MKKVGLLVLLLITIKMASAQSDDVKLPGLDVSPHDISWYRDDQKMPVVKVVYGRPQKRGRTMLGGVVPFGEVWRTGANEATEITFFQDVIFNGKKVNKGVYTMFTIPEEKKWIIILNSYLNQWGAYNYDKEFDVLRTTVPTEKHSKSVESFTIKFDNMNGEEVMIMAWENTWVKIPIKLDQ